MEIFIQQLINALVLGSIYALLALGYTMVYGIIKLINFAHGEVFMLGAFLGVFYANVLHLPFILVLLFSMASCALISVLIEFIAYRPLRNASRIAALITAIGVSFLLQNVMTYFFGADNRKFPELIKVTKYNFYGIEVSNIQLLIFGTTILLMVALTAIVKYSKMGKAMRAVSVDNDAARLMGINVNRTISFAFALGGALAAAGGVLIGMYYNSIDPMMGYAPGMKAFIAAVLGGIGIIPGAALGGFVLGMFETFAVSIGLSGWRDAIVYALLIIILLVKPAGILGKHIKAKV
ncbi:MAG: branched-chain amino acid ABC transporter permease [Lactobacillales bacterium]|jgi:branched-chain amino acid transport system permease protein|nr:branched-chain amino acid ABC transporter permease [Lactobacillales bacterium]